jgi:hypothetical protein
MNSPAPLLQPAQCALLLIDQQAGLAFGVGSSDRQVLLNNTVALARTAARRHTLSRSTPFGLTS